MLCLRGCVLLVMWVGVIVCVCVVSGVWLCCVCVVGSVCVMFLGVRVLLL